MNVIFTNLKIARSWILLDPFSTNFWRNLTSKLFYFLLKMSFFLIKHDIQIFKDHLSLSIDLFTQAHAQVVAADRCHVAKWFFCLLIYITLNFYSVFLFTLIPAVNTVVKWLSLKGPEGERKYLWFYSFDMESFSLRVCVMICTNVNVKIVSCLVTIVSFYYL